MQVSEFAVAALVQQSHFNQTIEDEPKFLLKVKVLILPAICDLILEEVLPLLKDQLHRKSFTRSVPPDPHNSVVL